MLTGKDLEQVEQMADNEINTIVSFHIPFLLHLLDGAYEMKRNDHWIAFQLARVNEPTATTSKFFGIRMEFPPDAEIPKDRFGRLAHTYVTVHIPYRILDDKDALVYECPECGTELTSPSKICSLCGATFTEEKARKPGHSVIKRTAIRLFNIFLEAYRFYSKEYHIEPIKNADIVSFDCDYMSKGKLYHGYKYLVDTGSGGVKTGSAFIIPDRIHDELRDFLKQGRQIEIQELLLCNSKNHLLAEEYPLVLIEAVSALEIVLSDFIRKEGKIAGISQDALKKFVRDVGVSGEVKVVLKLLTRGKAQLANDIYEDCEGAITLRNNVIHQGFLQLDPIDIKRRLISIEKMMQYAQKILG
jgi:predicted RNA-binding Zn-ribbon protein involved in translation (DUF1610 family)